MLFICATDIIAVTLPVMPTEAAAAIVPATQQPQLSFGNPSARGGREGTQGERGTGPGRLVSQSLLPCGYLYCLLVLVAEVAPAPPHLATPSFGTAFIALSTICTMGSSAAQPWLNKNKYHFHLLVFIK